MSIKLIQQFHANRDQSDISILNYSFCLAHNLFNFNKGHLSSMHCIACAFGNLGRTNVYSHGNFHTDTLYLLFGDGCPITKGAATEPRASHALQPHDCH
jgi:hypothetical protein